MKCVGEIVDVYIDTVRRPRSGKLYVPVIEFEFNHKKYRCKSYTNAVNYAGEYSINTKVVIGVNYNDLKIVIWNEYTDCVRIAWYIFKMMIVIFIWLYSILAIVNVI